MFDDKGADDWDENGSENRASYFARGGGGVLNRCTYGCGRRSARAPIGLRRYSLID